MLEEGFERKSKHPGWSHRVQNVGSESKGEWERFWEQRAMGKGLPFIVKGGSDGKESACNAGDLGSIPGSGRSPGEGMASHSSIIAWRIPWTEEVGGLLSMGL